MSDDAHPSGPFSAASPALPGIVEGAPLDLSDIPPGAIDDDGRVAAELACRSCGYNLRSLDPAGQCPECGAAVHWSLVGNLLRFADADWLDIVARGALWSLIVLVGGIVVGLLVGLLGGVVFALGPESGWMLTGTAGFGLIAATANGLTTWWITEPEPASVANPEPGDNLRRWSRILIMSSIVVGLLGVAVDVADRFIPEVFSTTVTVPATPTTTPPLMTPGQSPAPTPIPTINTVPSYSYSTPTPLGTSCNVAIEVFQVIGFAGLLCLARYLRRLALRAPATGLAKQTLIVFWGWIGLIAVGLLMAGVMSVVTSSSPGMGSSLAVMGVLGCGAGILAIGLGIWSLILYVRYYTLFGRHAGYAREVGAARGARAQAGPEVPVV